MVLATTFLLLTRFAASGTSGPGDVGAMPESVAASPGNDAGPTDSKRAHLPAARPNTRT